VATPELKSLGCAWGQRWSMFFNSMTHDKPYHIAYYNIIFYSKYLLKNIYIFINFYNKYLLFIMIFFYRNSYNKNISFIEINMYSFPKKKYINLYIFSYKYINLYIYIKKFFPNIQALHGYLKLMLWDFVRSS